MSILNCPFCGSTPVFPEAKDVLGTCYDAGCEDCGVPTISMQIIDCFEFDDAKPNRDDAHNSWNQAECKYGKDIIEVARRQAIEDWNTRK